MRKTSNPWAPETFLWIIAVTFLIAVLVGAIVLFATSNPPPTQCKVGEVPVHWGTKGGWACVVGVPVH